MARETSQLVIAPEATLSLSPDPSRQFAIPKPPLPSGNVWSRCQPQRSTKGPVLLWLFYVFIRERGRERERTSRGRAQGEGEHPRAHSRWARSPTPQPELKPRIRCLDDGATLTGLLMGLVLNEREAGIVGPWAPGSCEGQCGHVPSAQGEAVLGVGWAPPVLGRRLPGPPAPSEGKVSGGAVGGVTSLRGCTPGARQLECG